MQTISLIQYLFIFINTNVQILIVLFCYFSEWYTHFETIGLQFAIRLSRYLWSIVFVNFRGNTSELNNVNANNEIDEINAYEVKWHELICAINPILKKIEYCLFEIRFVKYFHFLLLNFGKNTLVFTYCYVKWCSRKKNQFKNAEKFISSLFRIWCEILIFPFKILM